MQNPTSNMMESPMCEERLYFDDWKVDSKVPTTSSSLWEDRENKPVNSSANQYDNSFAWPRTMESSAFKYPGLDTFAPSDSEFSFVI